VYAWTVIDSNTVFIGCNDGSNTYLYTSEDGGATWSNGMAAGTGLPSCIRVSPNYPQEPVIAVSDQAGWVHYSDDGGQLFRRLPLGAAVPPFNGSVTIAFDPRFTENRIIYAVSDSVQDGIYRFIVGSSEEWEKVDNRLPAGSSTTGVRVSNTGVLYALNSDTVNSADGEGGLERCLIPSSPLLPSFETVLNGLDDGIILNGLWNSGSRVWSVDTTNNRLMTMQDTLAQPARLLYPSQSAVIFTTTNIRLDWEVMEGATEYEWQVDFNGTFSAIPSDFSGTTAASSVYVPDVETGTTYHWRVRATKPLVSPWSERRSFTPASGDIPAGPTLVCPDAGASCDMNRPLFQWNPVDGTSKYEVIVAKDASFRKSVARKTISANVWQIDTDLENGLVYYWKVRGIGSGENTEWSAASAFMVAAPAQAEMQDTLRTQVVEPVPVRQNGPVLLSPSKNPGRTDEKPLFQWEEIKGAQGYELVIAEDESFDSPVLMKTGDYRLNNPVWNCNVNLEDNTAYYWKVRGVFEKGFSEWSLVSAFVVDCSKTVSENHSQPLIINVPYSPPEESSDKGEQWRELMNTMFSPVIQTILVLVVLIRTRRP
jgi:hypothetical protein